MIKYIRWLIFAFAAYTLSLMVIFFAKHPEEMLVPTYTGTRRAALFVFSIFVCIVLGKTLVSDLRNGPVAKNDREGTQLASSKHAQANRVHAHPFSTAFAKRPVLASMFVAFPFLVPFLLRFAVPGFFVGSRGPLIIVFGELIAAAVCALAWFKAKRGRLG